MKNLYILFVLFFSGSNFYSQTNSDPGFNYTAPSAAGITSYVNSPVSFATGIPDINIPLFSLPTHNKSVTVNTGLGYHPNNTGKYSKASEVGLGWMLQGVGGAIYREINPYSGFPADFYYYNFFGNSGKFKFFTDGTGTRTLAKLTNDRLKISFAESGGDYKFTVTDEQGMTYIFDTRDKAYTYVPGIEEHYTGAYYLTRVVDTSQQELISFGYMEDHFTARARYGDPIPVKSLKVNSIISHDFGSISLQYTVDPTLRKKDSDQFSLNSIELKNISGKTNQKYIFQNEVVGLPYPKDYSTSFPDCWQIDSKGKRRLNKLLKYDSQNNFQTTEFTYNHPAFPTTYWVEPVLDCYGGEAGNPKYLNIGLLSSIKMPTGTVISYEYEPNQYYVNKNSSNYLTHHAPPNSVADREAQFYEDVGEYPFDFTDGAVLGLFHLAPNPDNSEGSSYIAHQLHVYEYYNNPFLPSGTQGSVSMGFDTGISTPQGSKFMPGYNGFHITGTGGRGVVIIKRVRYRSVPLASFSTGNGVRIKKIEYYDNNVPVASASKTYEYQDFSNSAKPSGFLNDFGDGNSVVYKNVKETTGNGSGYTKYYFKAMNDYPVNINTDSLFVSNSNLNYGLLKYSNILDKGLHYKTEIYDQSHSKVREESTVHEFEETGITVYDAGTTATYAGSAIIKKQLTTASTVLSNGNITETNEITRNRHDLNITFRKSTASDGMLTEQSITYPWAVQLTDPRLSNAGLTAIPLITETKRNGVVISKSETKYENTSHYYPTSQVSYLPDNLTQPVKNVSYDIYDDKGNLVQYTAFPETGNGVSTTVIWGYNKTMPIAKVEGAKLTDIPSQLVNAIVAASNGDANATAAQEAATESALVNALNTFRNDGALKAYMISCYTYDPLIGVTKMIPSTGMMEIYEYDTYNRLKKIRDVNGVTLKEYQYNYKH